MHVSGEILWKVVALKRAGLKKKLKLSKLKLSCSIGHPLSCLLYLDYVHPVQPHGLRHFLTISWSAYSALQILPSSLESRNVAVVGPHSTPSRPNSGPQCPILELNVMTAKLTQVSTTSTELNSTLGQRFQMRLSNDSFWFCVAPSMQRSISSSVERSSNTFFRIGAFSSQMVGLWGGGAALLAKALLCLHKEVGSVGHMWC